MPSDHSSADVRPCVQPTLWVRSLLVPFTAGCDRGGASRETALRFVEFLLSVEGRDELRRSGFTPLPEPEFPGTPPEGLALSVRRASLVR